MTSRVLDMIELLCERRRMSLSDIARELDASRSSLFPVLKTMVGRGYFAYSEETYLYSLGSKFVEIYGSFASHSSAMDMILDVMERLRNECSETVHLGVLRGIHVVYMAKKDSLQQVRIASAIGRRVVAHATGLGKAILSCYTPEEIGALYDGRPLAKLTDRTITDMDALLEDLETVRERGYSVEICESSSDIMCIGVPVRDADGHVLAALSIAFPEYRYDRAQMEAMSDMLRRTAREVEEIIAQMDGRFLFQ